MIWLGAALWEETALLRRKMKKKRETPEGILGELAGVPLCLVHVGVGAKEWNKTLSFSPKGVVFIGCAGGLSKKLCTGDVGICHQIVFRREKEQLPLPSFSHSLPLWTSVTTEEMIHHPKEKQRFESLGDVVEMEHWWIYQWAKKQNLPCLFLRSVLDPWDWELPDLGNPPAFRKILTFAVRHPWRMYDLSSRFFLARKRLTQTLWEVLPCWYSAIPKDS